MAIPPKQEIIDIFEQLVAEGAIVYGPYETIEESGEGFPVSHDRPEASARLLSIASPARIPHLPLSVEKAIYGW